MVSSTYPYPLFPHLPEGRRGGENSGGYPQTPTRWGAPPMDFPVTQTSQPYNVILNPPVAGEESPPGDETFMVRQVPPTGRAHHPDNPDLSRRYRYRYRRDIGNNGTLSLPVPTCPAVGIEGSPKACLSRLAPQSGSKGHPDPDATSGRRISSWEWNVRGEPVEPRVETKPLNLSLSKGERVLHTKLCGHAPIQGFPQIYTGAIS